MFSRFSGKEENMLFVRIIGEGLFFEPNVKPFVFQYELFMLSKICILTKGDRFYIWP